VASQNAARVFLPKRQFIAAENSLNCRAGANREAPKTNQSKDLRRAAVKKAAQCSLCGSIEVARGHYADPIRDEAAEARSTYFRLDRALHCLSISLPCCDCNRDDRLDLDDCWRLGAGALASCGGDVACGR